MAAIGSIKLLGQLEINELDVILREKRLRWFGHVESSCGAIKTACDIQIEGKHGPGPRFQDIDRDLREWNLNEVDPCD